MEAKQVPLIELLEKVPANARLEIHDPDGMGTKFIPVGKMCHEAITALRAAIEQAQEPETELETYKRLYELRGKALERPCSNCGHQPAKIKAMAQPEYKPRRWQGLTDDDIAQAMYRADAIITGSMQFKFAREIEAKLKEKNT